MTDVTFDDEVTVRHVRYANAQTGWAVLDAAAHDGTPVALVGPLVHLEPGERARVVGTWVTEGRYGPQVKVAEAQSLPPRDMETLTGYLRRIKHIGVKRAVELVDRFGAAEVFDAVDRDPVAAFTAVGLPRTRAEEAAASWQRLRVTRRLHLLLAPHGLAYLAARIHDHYGPGAHEVLTRDPYQLTAVFGVGFTIADRIAHASGAAADGVQRARAAIVHVLSEAERSGSSCLPLPALLAQAGELLAAEVDTETVDGLVGAGHLVRDQEWIYRAATAELEAELADRVDELIHAAPADRLGAAPRREPGAAPGREP
ncbi:MAG: helix-hairpin-helix domain-containing protein, partial [Solirubrobacteraceae bacterium]